MVVLWDRPSFVDWKPMVFRTCGLWVVMPWTSGTRRRSTPGSTLKRPRYVFLVAGTVGGIHANSTRPADFLYDNLMIHSTVVQAAHRTGVDKLLYLGSSCIYPRHADQPITEEALLTGPLEPTNEGYALAKIAGIKLCETYRRQYGDDFISAMPTNLYGPGDNFDLWGVVTCCRP
ncbi:MAG: hypothetical protein CM1200mP26_09810 [Acidimicrobiales bacterium]|nr:MAG: hypothetical protein CM1200mP26_09810 [Acidimicrobiales bacterium]